MAIASMMTMLDMTSHKNLYVVSKFKVSDSIRLQYDDFNKQYKGKVDHPTKSQFWKKK